MGGIRDIPNQEPKYDAFNAQTVLCPVSVENKSVISWSFQSLTLGMQCPSFVIDRQADVEVTKRGMSLRGRSVAALMD